MCCECDTEFYPPGPALASAWKLGKSWNSRGPSHVLHSMFNICNRTVLVNYREPQLNNVKDSQAPFTNTCKAEGDFIEYKSNQRFSFTFCTLWDVRESSRTAKLNRHHFSLSPHVSSSWTSCKFSANCLRCRTVNIKSTFEIVSQRSARVVLKIARDFWPLHGRPNRKLCHSLVSNRGQLGPTFLYCITV
jgi:hypothetical protein